MIKIIINGVEKEIEAKSLGYSAIVFLANKEAKHKPTVTYKKKDLSGTVTPGNWVFTEEGMNFNVANTGSA